MEVYDTRKNLICLNFSSLSLWCLVGVAGEVFLGKLYHGDINFKLFEK